MADYKNIQIEAYFDPDFDRFGQNFENKIKEFAQKFTVVNTNVFTRMYEGNQEYVGFIYYVK